MAPETAEQGEIEVPKDWKKGTLSNCPYYLMLRDSECQAWDGVYMALQRATDTALGHRNQGPCRRPCDTSGPTSSHNILLTRGSRADNVVLGQIISMLVESMPEIEVRWE